MKRSYYKDRLVGKIRHLIISLFKPEETDNTTAILDEVLGKDFPRKVTTRDLEDMYLRIKKLGLKNFDVALPLDWVKGFQSATGVCPIGHFVYSYERNSFGEPAAITRTGEILLPTYRHIEGQRIKTKYKTDC